MTEAKQTSPVSPPPPQPVDKKGMSTGAKVGIGIGIGFFVPLIVIVIIAVFTLIASKQVSEQVKKQEEELKSEYTINEVIKSGNKTLTITSFVPFVSSSEYDISSEGKASVMVGVTITNESNQRITYNSFDFEIEDSNGNKNDTIVFDKPIPNQFQSGQLTQRGKVSGNMVFYVPAGDQNLKLIATPNFWGYKRIIIKLK